MHKDGSINAGWIFYFAESTQEYVTAEYEVDKMTTPFNGYLPLLFVMTDQGSFKGVVEDNVQTDVLIDLFENEEFAKRYCEYIKEIITQGYSYSEEYPISDEQKTKLEDWYLSNEPKYKVMV